MAIQRTKRSSDIDRQLKLINQQLYGKNRDEQSNKGSQRSLEEKSLYTLSSKQPTNPREVSTVSSDIIFLRKDLFKIVILSSIAVAFQLALHFGLLNNILALLKINV